MTSFLRIAKRALPPAALALSLKMEKDDSMGKGDRLIKTNLANLFGLWGETSSEASGPSFASNADMMATRHIKLCQVGPSALGKVWQFYFFFQPSSK